MGDARDALGGPRKSSLLKASTSLSELSPWRYRLSRLKTPHSFKMSVFPKLIIMIPIKMPVGFFFFGVGVCVKNKLQDLSGNAESLKDYLRKKRRWTLTFTAYTVHKSCPRCVTGLMVKAETTQVCVFRS